MEWESPWGVGFPGWHLECSAMAMELLGETIDIHTGGVDHIAVHHTNEIAQSECATGKLFSRIWMHGEFLLIGDQEKMAKSGDNFLTLQSLIERGSSPLAYRYLCLMTHYRSKLNFSWKALQGAQTGWQNLRARIATLQTGDDTTLATNPTVTEEYKEQFFDCINDDLNAPRALDILGKMLRDLALSSSDKLSLVSLFDSVLGLGFSDTMRFTYTDPLAIDSDVDLGLTEYAEVFSLLQQRKNARDAKEWQESDRLRDTILGKFKLRVEDVQGGKIIIKTS
jgi:cysteinyl-tRNA synthetase